MNDSANLSRSSDKSQDLTSSEALNTSVKNLCRKCSWAVWITSMNLGETCLCTKLNLTTYSKRNNDEIYKCEATAPVD